MKPFKQAMAEALEGKLAEEQLKLLPSGFQAIGDVVILNLKPELMKHKKEICNQVLKLYPRFKTVCNKVDAVKGEERLPSMEKVAGNGTETVHSENGCLYKLDVTKMMFAKGNTKERGRLAGVVKDGETIVDMFCGVGYFSIPIAKAGKAGKIYALEINPTAVKYLKQNIRLNSLKDIEAFNCDNRKTQDELKGTADRVLMGYLPGTDKFLDAAFWFLKPSGGVIHFHDVYRDSELWDRPISVLKQYAEKYGMKLKVLDKHIVKQYAPRMQHVVIDAEFRKT